MVAFVKAPMIQCFGYTSHARVWVQIRVAGTDTKLVVVHVFVIAGSRPAVGVTEEDCRDRMFTTYCDVEYTILSARLLISFPCYRQA